jgi:hypothetical protein
MVFPYVGTLDSLLAEDITITADDTALPYNIFIGDVVDRFGSRSQGDKEAGFSFSEIIGSITDEPYAAKNFSESDKGKLYILDVRPTADQEINFAVDFEFDWKKTKVLTSGFNRYQREDEKTRIAAWCYGPQVLEIFVLGEDIELEINAYTDGELQEETDLFTCEMSSQDVGFKSYLMEYIKNNTHAISGGILSQRQLYNLYAESLDTSFTRSMGYSSGDDLVAEESHWRILTFVYTVDFPPNCEKEVSVSYRTLGTMDRTQTVDPQYSFDYILNPAENWSGFKNLNIEIITPQKAPYVIASSIEFVRGEGNIYTAALDSLPEDDLSFTLYAKERISPWDKAARNLTSLVLGGIALLSGAIIIVALLRKYLCQNRDQTGKSLD